MQFNPAKLLNPIFNALEGLISDYGFYCYLLLVWLSLAVIVWILSGGLRRKRPHDNSATVIHGIIIAIQPPLQSPPPIVITDVDLARNGDDEIMDEP